MGARLVCQTQVVAPWQMFQPFIFVEKEIRAAPPYLSCQQPVLLPAFSRAKFEQGQRHKGEKSLFLFQQTLRLVRSTLQARVRL